MTDLICTILAAGVMTSPVWVALLVTGYRDRRRAARGRG